MKGIILAGGTGARLSPVSRGANKHLLPVYDKPMIYYPLAVLLQAGIRDLLVITNPSDVGAFEKLLGAGRRFGARIQFAEQPNPGGIAEALIIGRPFVGQERVALALGDNILFGPKLQPLLDRAVARTDGATVFACPVRDPERFGVVALNKRGMAMSLVEKPTVPASRLAVVGLYFYDHQAVDLALQLSPSERGELEITDLNRLYLSREQLFVERLSRGTVWLDAGTCESLWRASCAVRSAQGRQRRLIGCPEEVALRAGFISPDNVIRQAHPPRNDYDHYLLQMSAACSVQSGG
ncbi:MAG: NTP transferase domain-containing protein [Planctomycetes bacterium]|nr:NTP transferase domain-containing protein [Planctomycetota bacterium]